MPLPISLFIRKRIYRPMETFSIVQNNDDLWQKIYSIAQSDHEQKLWRNYQQIDLDDYIAMIVYAVNDQPVGFSGIYNNPDIWPDNVARFGNRTYIVPEHRSKGGTSILYKNFQYILDNYYRWGVDVLFFSVELYNDPDREYRKFELYNKYYSKKTGFQLTFDDRIYQCCKTEKKKCYHFCSFYNPKNITFGIKNYDKEAWHLL